VRRTALLFAGILVLGLDAAAIEIGKFDVSVLLDPDGTIFVTETTASAFRSSSPGWRRTGSSACRKKTRRSSSAFFPTRWSWGALTNGRSDSRGF